jgi:hypothetical protein
MEAPCVLSGHALRAVECAPMVGTRNALTIAR